jgi:lipopolysaccharide/colanic/teichoic acid biosynthesis glycosyltransferase
VRSPLVKRLLDVVIATPAFVLSLPIQGALAVVIARKLGRPVLFRQRRPGLHGRSFDLVKFRTMLPIDEASGRVDDASRMTDLGRILRSTSLDELPTLWNVIRGDMSLVGPRPLLERYLPLYTPEQARRHEVRPGLTGLAQVSGRNAISWDRKLALDVKYVDTWTIGGDLRIVWLTLAKVIKRDGITAEGEATSPEFTGSVDGPPEPNS